MKNRVFLFLVLAFALAIVVAGCETKYDDTYRPASDELPFTATYTYPPHMMREFPLTGAMVIRFNKTLADNINLGMVRLQVVNDNQTLTVVPVAVHIQGPALIIPPQNQLLPMHRYELWVSSEIHSADGEKADIPTDGLFLAFDTASDRPLDGVAPTITTVMPDPSSNLVFDVQTFRAFFSEPLAQDSIIYGETVRLTDAAGTLVAGNLFFHGNQIVFDPAEDLPGGKYAMTFGAGLTDINGEKLGEDQVYNYDVRNSYPHAVLRVENCPTTGEFSSCEPAASPEDLPFHPLTGNYTNSMKTYSDLLGDSSVFLSGQMEAEQCATADHPDFIPIVIRAGQQLRATSLGATLGGQIDTGLETGTITIHVLTDAVGFMARSDAFTSVVGGPTYLTLLFDSAITTEDDNTNVMMAQNILGTQLYGQAFVDDESGRLVMQMAGVAEIFVLGERISTRMSLEMQDAIEFLEMPTDTAPPSIRVTSPTPGSPNVRLGDPISLVFDEPVESASARSFIGLRKINGAPISCDLLVNGAKVLLIPHAPLEPDTTYRIVVGAGLTDLHGNVLSEDKIVLFGTGAIEWSGEPPYLGTTNPGNGLSPSMPGHFPIEVFFSQIMDPDTIVLGDTFRVLDLSAGIANVPGTLVKQWYRYSFFPNVDLIPGHYYRVAISKDVTNYMGIGLDLDYDHSPGGMEGVAEIWIDFVAAAANSWVPLVLAIDPLVDRDGSGYIDNTEVKPTPDCNYFDMMGSLIPENAYAAGYMVSWIYGLDYDLEGQPFMDIQLISGNFMHATSTGLTLEAILDFIGGLINPDELSKAKADGLFDPMGRILIDVGGMGDAPTVTGVNGSPQMNISMSQVLTLDNAFYNEALVNEFNLDAVGELSFTDDGKMLADINASTAMTMNLEIPLVGWTIPLPVPTTINMRTTSLGPLDWWNAF